MYSRIYKENLKKIRAELGPGKAPESGSRTLRGRLRWIDWTSDSPLRSGQHRKSRCKDYVNAVKLLDMCILSQFMKWIYEPIIYLYNQSIQRVIEKNMRNYRCIITFTLHSQHVPNNLSQQRSFINGKNTIYSPYQHLIYYTISLLYRPLIQFLYYTVRLYYLFTIQFTV